MKLNGFYKIAGLTIDGYVLTDTKYENDEYLANVLCMNGGTPLIKTFSFKMFFEGNNVVLMMINDQCKYTNRITASISNVKTLSSFTNIYTDMLKKSLAELIKIQLNSSKFTHLTSSFSVY